MMNLRIETMRRRRYSAQHPIPHMSETIKIGMIGCDTSHSTQFSRILNDTTAEDHLPGARVIKAFPGGSPDLEMSHSRVEKISGEIAELYGVELVSSIEEAAEGCDAVLLESVDGRVHLEQFKKCLAGRVPVYIDKPLAVDSGQAREIARLAEENGVPIMSTSALRYAEAVQAAIAGGEHGPVQGADCHGPMALIPEMPGYFWYGIHAVEMLYTVMGAGCQEVRAIRVRDHDLAVGVWADGRIGTVRGKRGENRDFVGLVQRANKTLAIDVAAQATKPFYYFLLEKVMEFFRTGQSPIPLEETLETIRFMEAANESVENGQPVRL